MWGSEELRSIVGSTVTNSSEKAIEKGKYITFAFKAIHYYNSIEWLCTHNKSNEKKKVSYISFILNFFLFFG